MSDERQPATSIDTLYDFETPIEDALVCLLGEKGIVAHTTRSTEIKPEAFTIVTCKLGDEHPTRKHFGGSKYVHQYEIELEINISTKRDETRVGNVPSVTTEHAATRAKVRRALQDVPDALNQYLEFHGVYGLQQSGTSFSVDGIYDVTKLSLTGSAGILDSAWPQ